MKQAKGMRSGKTSLCTKACGGRPKVVPPRKKPIQPAMSIEEKSLGPAAAVSSYMSSTEAPFICNHTDFSPYGL